MSKQSINAIRQAKTGKVTNAVAELRVINNIITKNKKMFKAGSTISRADFVKLFGVNDVTTGTYKALQRANLVLVGVQNKVNRLMRENGLYLKSQDYYNEFVVVSKPVTKRTVLNHSKKADIQANATDRLVDALDARVNRGNWGTYNKVPNSVIARIGSPLPSSARHQGAIVRVKTI